MQTLNSCTLFLCVIPLNGGVNMIMNLSFSCFPPSRQLLQYATSAAALPQSDNQARLNRDTHHVVIFSTMWDNCKLLLESRKMFCGAGQGGVPAETCECAPCWSSSFLNLASLSWLTSCSSHTSLLHWFGVLRQPFPLFPDDAYAHLRMLNRCCCLSQQRLWFKPSEWLAF